MYKRKHLMRVMSLVMISSMLVNVQSVMAEENQSVMTEDNQTVMAEDSQTVDVTMVDEALTDSSVDEEESVSDNPDAEAEVDVDADTDTASETGEEEENEESVIAEGRLTSDITWKIDQNGTLFILGTGLMPEYDFMYYSTVPWREYSSYITSIEIENGITSIGEEAFNGLNDVTSVSIPGSVTSIEYSAFENCSSLTDITIPDSVSSIGDYAFQDCSSLTEITIPDSVISIGFGAFENCSSLTEIIIPKSVTSIGSSAFENCSSLTEITIPKSVTSIGGSVFENCNSLKRVTVLGKIGSIGSRTFYNCSSLTDITIPSRVSKIGKSAFYGCNKLSDVYFDGTDEQFGGILIEENNAPLESAVIHLADGSTFSGILQDDLRIGGNIDISVFWTLKRDGTLVIYGSGRLPSKDDIEWLENYDADTYQPHGYRSYRHYITQIEIGNEIDAIGYYSFSGLNNLKSITIPDSVKYFDEGAFYGCTSLTGITIPDSVTSIGNSAFAYCDTLTRIKIPGSVTSIGDSAFNSCKSLTRIKIPGSVTSIGNSTFSNCKSLTSITIPNSVTSIGKGAFDQCTRLSNVYFTGTREEWNALNIGDNNDSLLNAAIYFGSSGPDYDSMTFTDVPETAYYYDAVQWAVGNEITSGTAGGETFNPAGECTRAQVVTFLWRAAGKPEPKSDENPFEDINSSNYFYKAVLWANEQGITGGKTATTFDPESTVTRAQVVSFLWRAAGRLEPTVQSTSLEDIQSSDYYYKAVLWAVENGITLGKTKTTFLPEGPCTRAQVVTFMYRAK